MGKKERPWKQATLLLNQIVKINLLSQVIRFPSQCPHSEISNSDHQFFLGALSKKEDDFFGKNKLSFENIWILGTEEASL